MKLNSIIMNLAKKFCALDPIPTPLLVKCIDALFDLSKLKWLIFHLKVAIFLSMEEVLVRPILKKNGLDTVFKNFWPVSNLYFISKVTERACFYPSLQSAYRKNHCTETELLKVTNNILMEINSEHAVLTCVT